MKKLLIVLLSGLIQIAVFAQPDSKAIRISENLELIQISEHAYVHVSCAEIAGYGRVPSNGLIFTNGNEAFLFDTPCTDSLTKDLFNWITDSMKLKIVGFVPNHWHVDCMGGLGFLQRQKISSYANQMTIDIARSKNLPVPCHGFKDSIQLRLGDKLIQCYYLGAAHTLDNIVVWIPSEQILFAGCMIKSINSTNLGNTVDGDLIAYPKTINKLIDRFSKAKIVIPGHGYFGGFDLIIHTKELITNSFGVDYKK